MHEFWELIAFVANVIIFIVVVLSSLKMHPTGMDFLILGLVYLGIHLVRAINMGAFYPLMKKFVMDYQVKMPWLYGGVLYEVRLDLALAGCLYRAFRYEFSVAEGGKGYKDLTTSVFVVEKEKAQKLKAKNDLNLYHGIFNWSCESYY